MSVSLASPQFKLAFYRRQHHLTAAQLAERVGVSEDSIRSYELGRRRPRLATVERLQDVLGVRLVRAPRRRRNHPANSQNRTAVREFANAQALDGAS